MRPFSARSSSTLAPAARMWKSWAASLRARRSSCGFICEESLVQAVSGMASLGTSPYFLMMFMAPG